MSDENKQQFWHRLACMECFAEARIYVGRNDGMFEASKRLATMLRDLHQDTCSAKSNQTNKALLDYGKGLAEFADRILDPLNCIKPDFAAKQETVHMLSGPDILCGKSRNGILDNCTNTPKDVTCEDCLYIETGIETDAFKSKQEQANKVQADLPDSGESGKKRGPEFL